MLGIFSDFVVHINQTHFFLARKANDLLHCRDLNRILNLIEHLIRIFRRFVPLDRNLFFIVLKNFS